MNNQNRHNLQSIQMVISLTLDKFSTELIIKICSYLEIEDLCRLKRTCRRFNEIITSWDDVLCKNISTAVVTNQISDIFLLKCYRRLPKLEKLRISKNWIKGKYFERSFFASKKRLIPYLQLTNKYLWISRGANILCYRRVDSSLNVRRPHLFLEGKSKVDVVNFRITNDFLVCGFRDGSISLKKLNDRSSFLKYQSCHNSDINSVDIDQCGCIVVSGSRDSELKIWEVIDSEELLTQKCCVQLPDLVWKVSLSSVRKSNVAVATAGNQYRNSLFIYDLNKTDQPFELVLNNNIHNTVIGIFDIKWDGSDTLWTCGYDSYLRKWDLRTGKCVQDHLDPCGSSLYCLDYDHHNTIMTGAQLHGRVTLWDCRSGHALQMYYMDSCKSQRYNQSSPIYSLAFDADHLFTVTDQNLNVLDFSVYNASPKDYSFFLE